MTKTVISAAVLAILVALAGCAGTNPDGTPVKARLPASGPYDAN